MKYNYKIKYSILLSLIFLGNTESYCSRNQFDSYDNSRNNNTYSPQEIYDQAVGLRKENSYANAYDKFMNVLKMESETDLSVKALYNIGWIANERNWFDQSALFFLKSNALHNRLNGSDYVHAIKALNILKNNEQVQENVSFNDYPNGEVNYQWHSRFIIYSPSGYFEISHSPEVVCLGETMRFGGALRMFSKFLNGAPMSSKGLWVQPRMTKRDFINAITLSGLHILSISDNS